MFDAIIIGGGLAGCQAAITLARHNHRVLLLEMGAYPRPKVCGEFLSPECRTLFAQSGFLPILNALNPVDIRTLRISAPDGSEWRSKFPQPGLGISRFALDEALAHYAADLGVAVHDRARVIQIEGNLQDGFCVKAQTFQGLQMFEARTVIAAHGKRSPLDRALNRTFAKPSLTYVGLKQHFNGPMLPEHIDLHVFRSGYCGMSQVEDGTTNVCLMVRQDVFQEVSGDGVQSIDAFIDWMCAQNRRLGEWLSQAEHVYPEWLSIAQISLAPKPPVEGDILIAGDASGMVAPLAGDGMAMALQSGALAACAVDRHLTQRTSTLTTDYAHLWQQTFAARLRLGRVLQGVMLRPALLSPGLRLLTHLPAVGNWIIAHTRDLAPMEYNL